MCESDYFKVSFVKKLLEKKLNSLHDVLNDRFNVLSEELDACEEEFAKETFKDETELKKLTDYKLNTIEIFDEGDCQLTKIHNRIDLLQNRIEQRKVKIEFDDVSLREQLMTVGNVFKKKDVHLYEEIENFHIEYEIFEEIIEPKLPPPSPIISEPMKVFPSSTNRPPIPNRPNRPKGTNLSRLRSSSMGSLRGRKIVTCDTYTIPIGAVPKKSISLDQIQIDFKITAKCRMGPGPGQILKPKNVAISTKTGCIFVVEKGNNRVQVFASTGDPMYSITRKSLVPSNSMVKPYGVCILNERVYVSVTQFSCVHAYSVTGDFISKRGERGTSEGQFDFPMGMGTDGTNRVYVCDYGNNRVQAFSKDLHFKQIIGAGQLTNPTDIAVDHNSDLYVLDRSTTIVHLFNSKGVYQKKIIKIIKYPILSNPQFIAISPKGRIILSDLLSNSVNVFTLDGGLRQTLGGPRDKEMFGEPRGVAFDGFGNLVVVCHKENGCLQIIEMDV